MNKSKRRFLDTDDVVTRQTVLLLIITEMTICKMSICMLNMSSS